jgi:hypothetical protein
MDVFGSFYEVQSDSLATKKMMGAIGVALQVATPLRSLALG